ncbi:hypothetical protein AVEN_234863-1 [Araneus ventricosus]|uniref:Uncharacterized protein n=1 Tax=Araneus ventricosus TaxID=182803 RepID=A0A4Y2IG90_ARAVE|nr:hypothetical protein AVEN_234863-1 [Araneus ventricosus]
MRKGHEEIKNRIQSHVGSKVGKIKDYVNSCIERIEEVQSVKREIGGVKGEVERKIEKVEDKVRGKIEKVEQKVQVKIGYLEKMLNELEDRPLNFPFHVVSSANRWNNRVKASQLVASLRGIRDKLTDIRTIENALEARFGDSHLTQFYRTELKTRRQKPGESFQILALDVEAECPQDVRDNLAAQYFVDAIRYEDTQHATRLMDTKDLKSALAYI